MIIGMSTIRCSHNTDACTHRWTSEEHQFLRDNPNLTLGETAEALNRSSRTVRFKVKSLGLSPRPRPTHPAAWTEEEDQFIRDNSHGRLTQKQMGEALSRTWQAVAQRMIFLGVTSGRNGGGWTPEDDEVLKSLAGTMSWQAIADFMGRSWGAVQSRAWERGWGGRRTRTPEQQALIDEARGTHTYDYGPEWPQRRTEALERDGYRCQHPGCEVYAPSGKGLQVHHIVRRKLIQTDDLHWLVTLCTAHHMTQDAHWWPDFTPDMIERLPEYQQAIHRTGMVTT